MKNYILKTYTTMKEYNQSKYWINSDIVKEYFITAENINQALKMYVERVKNDAYIEITKNAIKTKKPMFIDTSNGTLQTGYVITGITEIEKDYCNYTKQYIDLWVEILTVVDTKF